jgi:dTDP-glucose 4,6-dehydratase
VLTVLLTGAGGFLGSHVLERLLLESTYDVICVDSFRHNGRVAAITNSTPDRDRVGVITHDLTAPFSTVDIDHLADVTKIINIASLASVDQSLQHPANFIRNNVDLMLNVLDLARLLQVETFIHMSTDEVHGSYPAPRHLPSSPYAASKAAQEDIAFAYGMSFGAPITNVVSCNMFGERQSTLAFIPRLVRQLTMGELVTIHTNENGEPGSRRYNYAGNVASYIVGLLDQDPRSRWHHYLAGQVCLTNIEVMEYVAGYLNLPTPDYKVVEGQRARPGYDFDYADLPRDVDWIPQTEFKAALEQTVIWLAEHLEWLR